MNLAINLSPQHKQILRWVGYPALALFVFLFAVQLTFPYERVKDRLEEVLRSRYDVSIVSVEPTLLPGGIILETVVLTTRPTQPDEEPTTVLIDRLRIDVGLLPLLLGKADVDLVADLGGGTIEGNVVVASDELEVSFETEDLPLENIPGLRGAVGLPMKGPLDASMTLSLPENRWDQAEGSIELGCVGCTIGDGKAKIKPRAPGGGGAARRTAVFASAGVTVPELNLGELTGKITIAEGKGTIEQFTAKSPDGDLTVTGAVKFGREFKDSQLDQGCMKFRLSDELKQREPNFGNVPSFMGVPPESDGYSNVKMRGKLVGMRWLPAKSCEDDGNDRVSSRNGGRPSLSGRGETEGEGASATAAELPPSPERAGEVPAGTAPPPAPALEVSDPNTEGAPATNFPPAITEVPAPAGGAPPPGSMPPPSRSPDDVQLAPPAAEQPVEGSEVRRNERMDRDEPGRQEEEEEEREEREDERRDDGQGEE